jgi:hypothetical protein
VGGERTGSGRIVKFHTFSFSGIMAMLAQGLNASASNSQD